METFSVSYAAYLSASIISLMLSIVFLVQFSTKRHTLSFTLAALYNTFWLFNIAQSFHQQLVPGHWLLFVNCAHYSMWILALNRCLKRFSTTKLPLSQWILFWSSWLVTLVGLGLALKNITPSPSISNMLLLCMTVMALLSVEQLYKNALLDRQIKILCINLGAIMVYDVYLHSHSLMFKAVDPLLWQARAVVYLATGLLMALGTALLNQPSRYPANLALSRPVAFYTSSLIATGIFISILSLGGYYVRLYGGNWGTVIYTLILFCALMLLAVVFVSRTFRSGFSVLINKHLFSHKYDYREEWLRIINALSQPKGIKKAYEQALDSISSIFKSEAGIVWIRSGNQYAPVYRRGIPEAKSLPAEPLGSPFCNRLKQSEWVFFPGGGDNEALSQFNEELPRWVEKIPNLWLLVPLITIDELVGFIALVKPKISTSPTWEDIDLLKTVGRQLANYLKLYQQDELLTEGRQFDAYNKLSAFIMHDINNLIAQQALVVHNAEKHKDNPAFIDDTILTISHSVDRMRNLLQKLKHNEPESISNFSLSGVVTEALDRCKGSLPKPELESDGGDGYINGDKDRLCMSITHLIKNAQEATQESGTIKVKLTFEKSKAEITIKDSGVGMDHEFIYNKLFKPFETTKSGKGMGIGVYLTRSYIQQLGGALDVESTPGEGTTFIITLNLMQE